MRYSSKIFLTILTTTLLFVVPASVFAQTPSPAVSGGANQQARLQNIISLGNAEIADRLAKLTNMFSRIDSLKRLNSTDKTTFENEITTNKTGLQNLQTKLDADTDITTARADRKSIFTDYRIYAVFLPQTAELVSADTMTTLADQLDAFSTTLASRISQAGANGHDVTQLKTWLADMKAKIADARTQYANVESQVTSLTPASYNTNPTGTQTILQNARVEIKTGRTDLQAAFQDGKNIRNQLKAWGTTSATSASPTP